MKLNVVIATLGRPRLLARTLESLSRCQLPKAFQSVIVVHNGTPASAEIRDLIECHREKLEIQYIHLSRANKSLALNKALDLLDDEVLAIFFDDDVLVEPNALNAYVRAARGSNRKFFGGSLAVDYERTPPAWVCAGLPRSAVGWTPATIGPHDYFLGANWAAFVGDIRRVGGFDLSFGPVESAGAEGDETTLQLKMQRDGLTRQYVSDALVRHYVPSHRASPSWALKKSYRIGKADGLLGRKLPGKRSVNVVLVRQLLRVTKYIYLRDPAGVFDATCKLARDLGALRGAVQRILRRGAQPPEPTGRGCSG